MASRKAELNFWKGSHKKRLTEWAICHLKKAKSYLHVKCCSLR